MNDLTKRPNQPRPAGEPFVWFTGVGLTLGLAMIAFLLGLIFIKGVEVFWPVRVVQLELKPESASRIRNSNMIAGTVTRRQKKTVKALNGPDGHPVNGDRREWQLFIGNKDIYGFNFKYVDYGDILKVEQPAGIMRIERREYGDVLAYPVALHLDGGKTIAAGEPAFRKTLHNVTREKINRWKEIKRIEKDEIGRINYRLEHLMLKMKSLASQTGGTSGYAYTQLSGESSRLQEAYTKLAGEVRVLRGMQEKDWLEYRLATGEQKKIPVGQVVHFYYPNQLNLFERIGLFFHHVRVFLTEEPREANTEGGVFPAIFGTFVMTVLMSAAVTPFGVLAAVYLREYAKQGFWVRCVRIAVNNLAGVPSIVFGVFGLGFFVYFVGAGIDQLFFKEALPTPTFGTGGILWASLTLALLSVPVVIVATEEALAAVPRGMREGSLACGASKWQTIKNIVLPAAIPGILTGLILAMARGAGEVAPLMLVGVVKLAPSLPIDGMFPFIHLERKFMHLGFHIYDLGFQSPDSEAAKPMVFATTLLLIGLVVILNVGAIYIRNRLRRKYISGAF